MLVTALASSLLLIIGSAKADPPWPGPTMVVTATGDPDIDTVALQSAFDALPAGGILHLSGYFRTHHEIYTYGFDGTVEGDGIDVTVIEAVRGPSGYFEPVFHLPNGQTRTAIFAFERGLDTQLTIRDLTFKCDDPEPCAPASMFGYPNPFPVLAAFVFDLFGENRNTVIENVKFDGEVASSPHDLGMHNTIFGVLSSVSNGHVSVHLRDCEAENIDAVVISNGHGPGTAELPNTIMIEGIVAREIGSLAFLESNQCDIKIIRHCQVSDSGGVYPMILLSDSGYLEVANCTFTNISAAAIEIDRSHSCLIRSNSFLIENGSVPGILFRSVRDSIVKANQLRGTMRYPFFLRENCSGNVFLGNNIRHAESAAKIRLGPEAHDNVLYGFTGGEVIDQVGDYTLYYNGEVMTQALAADGLDYSPIDLCPAGPAYLPDGEPGHYASGVQLVWLFSLDWGWGNFVELPGYYVEVAPGTGSYSSVAWGEVQFAPANWFGALGDYEFVQDCTIVPKNNYITGTGPMNMAP